MCNGCSNTDKQQKAIESFSLHGPSKVHVVDLDIKETKAYRVISYREPGYTSVDVVEVSPDYEVIEAVSEVTDLEASLKQTLAENQDIVELVKASFEMATFKNVGVYRVPIATAVGMKINSDQHERSLVHLPPWFVKEKKIASLLLAMSGILVIGVYNDDSIALFQGKLSYVQYEPLLVIDSQGNTYSTSRTGNYIVGGGGVGTGGGSSMAVLTLSQGNRTCFSQKSYPTYCWKS